MPNKKIMCLLPAVFALTSLNIFIVFQVSALKKSVSFLEAKVKVFDERLSAFLEQEKEMIENIDKKISLILNEQEENQKEIKNELERIKYRTDTQFSKTVSMSKTYDAILAEQKKKTVDTAEKDSAFIEAKKHAAGMYGKNEFNKTLGLKHQALYSYKLKFDFQDKNELSYLNGKTFEVKNVPFA